MVAQDALEEDVAEDFPAGDGGLIVWRGGGGEDGACEEVVEGDEAFVFFGDERGVVGVEVFVDPLGDGGVGVVVSGFGGGEGWEEGWDEFCGWAVEGVDG